MPGETDPLPEGALRHLSYLNEKINYIEELEGVLQRIAEQQPKTLAMIQTNGFVFDSIGNEPGNWQHLAFSIYTDLCEMDALARAALIEDPA